MASPSIVKEADRVLRPKFTVAQEQGIVPRHLPFRLRVEEIDGGKVRIFCVDKKGRRLRRIAAVKGVATIADYF